MSRFFAGIDMLFRRGLEPGVRSYLKAVAELSVVLSAALLLLGWSYLYGFYHTFGVSILELDVPSLATPVYAVSLLHWPRAYVVGTISVGLVTLPRLLPVAPMAPAARMSWPRRSNRPAVRAMGSCNGVPTRWAINPIKTAGC